MRRGRSFSVLTALALVGCGSFSMSFTNSGIPHPPMQTHTVEEVQIFASGAPTRHYLEAGLLEARGAPSDTPGSVLAKMREEAARLGCDGLIIIPTTAPKAFRASCIVFDAAPPPATSNAPTKM